jgi:hypothetical protein
MKKPRQDSVKIGAEAPILSEQKSELRSAEGLLLKKSLTSIQTNQMDFVSNRKKDRTIFWLKFL